MFVILEVIKHLAATHLQLVQQVQLISWTKLVADVDLPSLHNQHAYLWNKKKTLLTNI